jgi:serine/threonine protein kinase
LEYFYQELVDSEYVVQVKRSFLDEQVLYVEMEYANGGSLSDLIRYQLIKKKLLRVEDVWILFLQVLKGIDGFIFFELRHYFFE